MSEVVSSYGFKLPCRECGVELLVDLTNEFVEKPTNKKMTAYYAPNATSKDLPIGYSEGTGDSFECKLCHIMKWQEEQTECQNKTD